MNQPLITKDYLAAVLRRAVGSAKLTPRDQKIISAIFNELTHLTAQPWPRKQERSRRTIAAFVIVSAFAALALLMLLVPAR